MRPRHIPAALRSGLEEQAAVSHVFTQAGALVYSTSDPRARRPTPGIPDLLIVFPNRCLLLGWETKTGRGELTLEQREFGAYLASGLSTAFAWGDAAAAIAWLQRGPQAGYALGPLGMGPRP